MKKRILSFALILVMVMSYAVQVHAQETYTDGYLTYTISNGEATITECSGEISGDYTIPSTLGGKPVTTFDEYAFADNTGLTSIIIPDSVTSIGWGAFEYCTSLTSVTIPDSVTVIDGHAFFGCAKLISVIIPDSVTSIGSAALAYCTSLEAIEVDLNNLYYLSENGVLFNKNKTTLICYPAGKSGVYTIPDSVTAIGDTAFFNCTGLTSVTIPESVTSIGDDAFNYCTGLNSIAVPNSVTSIGSCAFEYCTGLSSITIPNSVTSIGSGAFKDTAYYNDSSNWESQVLYIGNHLIRAENTLSGSYEIKSGTSCIAAGAFSDCWDLNFITIPDSVTSIGDYAFYQCFGLNSIIIPKSVTSIGDYAFYNSRLDTIEVDKNNSYYSSENGVLFNKTKTTLIYCPAGKSGVYSIPNSVISIFDSAFEYCTSLTSVTIPEGVTSIGNWAFSDCYNLTSITIPDSVTSIGNCAFLSCSGLTSITIPDSVTYISAHTFYNCTALTSITIPGSITSIGYRAFDGCTNLKDVYYLGTQEEFAKISIGEYNEPLTSATIHYQGQATHQHTYDNDCDATCNTCGAPRTVPAHQYTNACDTTCNVCQAVRSITHTYDNACDTICNICQATRSITHSFGEYVYNNDATEEADGTKTRTCSVCKKTETITAEGTKLEKQLVNSSKLFTDVDASQWYKPYTDYVATYSIMNGKGGGKFAPEDTMTRAEFVQVLANLSNIDTSNKQVTTKFKDVKSGTWYAPAVKWANENGIVNGTSETEFSPNAVITREQMCTMLIRYVEGYLKLTFKNTATEKIFADDAKISSWAKESVYKCQRSGLISGVSATEFSPSSQATRAQVATIMTRYHQNYMR